MNRPAVGAACKALLNAAMLIAQRNFKVKHIFSVTLESKMPGFDDTGMYGPDSDLVDFFAFDPKIIRQADFRCFPGRGLWMVLSVWCMEANGFQPGMIFGHQVPLFIDLPFKPVRLGAERGQGREAVFLRVRAKRKNARLAVQRQDGPQTHAAAMAGLSEQGGKPCAIINCMDYGILKRLHAENGRIPDVFRLSAEKKKPFRD